MGKRKLSSNSDGGKVKAKIPRHCASIISYLMTAVGALSKEIHVVEEQLGLRGGSRLENNSHTSPTEASRHEKPSANIETDPEVKEGVSTRVLQYPVTTSVQDPVKNTGGRLGGDVPSASMVARTKKKMEKRHEAGTNIANFQPGVGSEGVSGIEVWAKTHLTTVVGDYSKVHKDLFWDS